MLRMLKKLFTNRKTLIIAGIIIITFIIITVSVLISDGTIGIVPNVEGTEIKNEFEELNNTESEDGKTYPEVHIPKNNILKYTNIDNIINVLETGGDEVIYIGYPSCVYCRNAIQVLMDTAEETDLDVIYYLNIEEHNIKYDELADALGDELVEITDGKKKIYVPVVIFITDGKIISYNKGTLFSQEDPYQTLDDSQVQGLSEIYRYGINDVVSSKKLKNNK